MERENSEIINDGLESLSIEIATLQNLKQSLDDQFASAVQKILKTKGRIIISGIGKSALIAQKLVASFNSTGTPSIFLHAADAIHGDLGMIRPIDELLIISKSGNTPEVKVLVRMVKEFGNAIISLCSNPDSYLAQECTININIPVGQEADPNNLAPTSSTLAQMAIGDALTVALIKAKGFTKNHFAKFHPGGTLGKELFLKIEEVMKGQQKPEVSVDANIQDVIIEISSKRMGATAVVQENGDLAGIITDGDLRRMLQGGKEADTLKAKDIMSLDPKTIDSDDLAINALSYLRQNKVSQLIVMKDSAYFGIVHVHEIIKAGVS